MATPRLPPTVNMHVVGHCNFRCKYCYARFQEAKTFLALDPARGTLESLGAHGVTRVTFAGGEPTLHPDLVPMLRCATEAGLITALVTNGSFSRDLARRMFPWLRWLVLSVDSDRRSTNDAIGRRRAGTDELGQVDRVERVVSWLRDWNEHRPELEHVRLKLNLVVNALNIDEDPADWLARLRPERVKLLQCSVVPGENDDASGLVVSSDAFAAYAARVARLRETGIVVVAEDSSDILDSYAMVDPLGRFRQSRRDGYVESSPIHEVGVERAWEQVGGCDLDRFRARGGEYDAGTPAAGRRHPIVAVEGLDGVGKSTAVHALAARLGAGIVTNPPARMREERTRADSLPPDERRAWYWDANRAAMSDASDLVFSGRAVVMDRCFASTAVYAAAERGTVAKLSDVPRDIARPDLILRLHLREAERQTRQLKRAARRTTEESRLDTDDAFRGRVLAGYDAVGAVEVDATGTVEQTLDAMMAPLRRSG